MTTNTAQEQDVRLSMLNTFLSCPHRDTDQVKAIHEQLAVQDPLFYAHLACWYRQNGDIRDHNEVFASILLTTSYLENREVGLALWQKLPPFMKSRVLGFIKGKKVKIRHKTGRKKRVKGGKQVEDVRIEEKVVGLFKNPPTAFKREVEKYLRYLEASEERFDSVVVKNAKDLKTLYASLKIRPSSRANSILFKKKYPEDSKMTVFEQIANAKTPDEAAELIVKNKIPYTTAVGLIEKMTPSILVALINNMSPQEVINNIASLEDRGAMSNPGTKTLIEKKLQKAQKAKNVSALKSKQAQKTGRVKDEAIIKKLDDVADVQIKKGGKITVPTAVFIDRSGSLSQAIEVGKSCAALISGATEAPLYVIAFDNMPMEIVSQGPNLSDWERAFRPVRTGGQTSVGSALRFLIQNKPKVDQIVVITDGGENAAPFFVSEYERYADIMKVRPSVVVIRVGYRWYPSFVNSLQTAQIEHELYTPDTNDYYGLPGLIPLLARTTKLDLLIEIMQTPLLSRKAYKEMAPYPEFPNRGAARKLVV